MLSFYDFSYLKCSDTIERVKDGPQGIKTLSYTKRIYGHDNVIETVSPRCGVLRVKTTWKVPTSTLNSLDDNSSSMHLAHVRNGRSLTSSTNNSIAPINDVNNTRDKREVSQKDQQIGDKLEKKYVRP